MHFHDVCGELPLAKRQRSVYVCIYIIYNTRMRGDMIQCSITESSIIVWDTKCVCFLQYSCLLKREELYGGAKRRELFCTFFWARYISIHLRFYTCTQTFEIKYHKTPKSSAAAHRQYFPNSERHFSFACISFSVLYGKQLRRFFFSSKIQFNNVWYAHGYTTRATVGLSCTGPADRNDT